MNGANGEIAKTRTLGPKTYTTTQPVFISEGANMPGGVSNMNYFEVNNEMDNGSLESPDEEYFQESFQPSGINYEESSTFQKLYQEQEFDEKE